MKHLRKNYFERERAYQAPQKFNMLFESIMAGTPIFEDIKSNPIPLILNKQLSLITEEICRPVYVVSESTGDAILLEEAIFYDEETLIMEGILDKVFDAVKALYEKIKAGIMKVLSEASDAIKAFCEKVMNSKIVVAIRKKLNLDSKINKNSFSNAYEITDPNGKAISTEAVLQGRFKNGQIIVEEAKLSKKEKAIEDPEELEKIIQKWQDALDGKIEIKSKRGKRFSKRFIQKKLDLLNERLDELEEEDEEEDDDSDSGDSNASSDSDSGEESKNEKVDASKLSVDKNTSDKVIGCISIKSNIVTEKVSSVGEECTSDEAAKSASNTAAVAEGGEEAKKVITGNGEGSEEAPKEGEGEGGEEAPKEEKKKGFFSKISDGFNSAMNKAKDKIKEGIGKLKSKVKEWYAKQNKWVKMLIWAIIVIIAIFAIWWLITGIIMPVLYGLLHGGLINAAAGTFKLVSAGKTFVATYKAGKNAWETGTGWGKFFLLLGGSILACITIGQMASQGKEMMDAAKSGVDVVKGAKAAGESAKGSSNDIVNSKSKNPFDLNGDGNLSQSEMIKMFKENKIPGIDLKDPRYADANGWSNFTRDLMNNKDFRKIMGSSQKLYIFRKKLQMNLSNLALKNLGVSSHNFHGNSWFQTALGIDTSKSFYTE